MSEALCTKCRTEGDKLFLKGEKCEGPKCPIVKKNYTPGQHGPSSSRRRLSEYGVQLREKQKVKKIYGVRERQFSNYFKKAVKSKGITGEILLQYLEKRLDNTVYRMGLADSRAQARQFVSHGHILVNGKKVDISSYSVSIDETISVLPAIKESTIFKAVSDKLSSHKTPEWLKMDAKKMEGKVIREPQRDDIDADINENLIIEFYSR